MAARSDPDERVAPPTAAKPSALPSRSAGPGHLDSNSRTSASSGSALPSGRSTCFAACHAKMIANRHATTSRVPWGNLSHLSRIRLSSTIAAAAQANRPNPAPTMARRTRRRRAPNFACSVFEPLFTCRRSARKVFA